MRKCPVCHAPLVAQTRQGCKIDVCLEHGLWLDQHELLLITEADRHERGSFEWADLFRRHVEPPRRPDRHLHCPRCEGELRLEMYADVQIDWCPKHGVWLDNGELDAIINNLRLDPMYLRGLALRISDARF